jgi:signal transduction histidine kinase
MGKRLLPEGVKCAIVSISVTSSQLARLRRRKAEERAKGNRARATISGVIRMDAHAAQRLRHDLRGPLGALKLYEEGFRNGDFSLPELLEAVRNAVTEITAIVAEEGGG